MQALFDDVEAGGRAREDQWRLSEVQIANWGTFDGAIYRIPIARRGHLLTGPSGSGKSSLLDAISAVLTPDRWLGFNVAAQGADSARRKRTSMSYLRGAWTQGTDDDEDRVVSKYLRPRATWGGVLLCFENENHGDSPITLGRLFFAKGTSTSSADLADLRIIDRSHLDLKDLQPFLVRGLETRKIQKEFPKALVTGGGKHARFFSRLRTLFDIPAENALNLLHKTQSTKNLDSLDLLFRNYMLERPGTFNLAETAEDQFEELHSTYRHVTELRRQRDHLEKLRAADADYVAATKKAAQTQTLLDSLPRFQDQLDLQLTRRDISTIEESLRGLCMEEERADHASGLATRRLDTAKERERELGGSQVRHLREHISFAERNLQATTERWEAMRRQLDSIGIPTPPRTALEYAELQQQVDGIIASAQKPVRASYAEHSRLSQAREVVENLKREIESLRRTGSSIPRDLLHLRQKLAKSLGVPDGALPFVGETLEVRDEYGTWAGAIERVLRPFALTLLVRPEHLGQVRKAVDGMRILTRLVYEEALHDAGPPRAASSDISLINRVKIHPGPFQEWVSSELSLRYDYACVDNPDDMADYPRAVTVRGQLKTSRTRYTKDDRQSISDRSRWVLGDSAAKMDALLDALQTAQSELDRATEVVAVADGAHDRALRRDATLRSLIQATWADLDRETGHAELDALRDHLRQLTDAGSDLAEANVEVEAAQAEVEETTRERNRLSVAVNAAEENLDRLRRHLADLEARDERDERDDPSQFSPRTEKALESLFRQQRRQISRETLPSVGQKVSEQLHRREREATTVAGQSAQLLVHVATQFKETWPSTAADLVPSVEDRGGFLEIYESILAHGLPEHESRFLQLLRERSRDLVGELVSDILGAPRGIRERIAPINDSLQRSEFDDDRYLRIRVKNQQSATVRRFVDDLRRISTGSWDDQDLVAAEVRFEVLKEIMVRFGSSLPEDKRWKNECLDTRRHVSFLAEEVDSRGTVHATYDSASAMSGGQQQKLVIFCLAAALRYQLATPDATYSRYGTVILDEAFDKADVRFTRLALEVFREFGFQLILATPQKFISVIEPYVGAITSIENPTRQRTQITSLTWEEVKKKEEAGVAP